MRKKRFYPIFREAQEAILQPISRMTKKEWEYWTDKLSRAPEGVYDPWSEENWVEANGAEPRRDPAGTGRDPA